MDILCKLLPKKHHFVFPCFRIGQPNRLIIRYTKYLYNLFPKVKGRFVTFLLRHYKEFCILLLKLKECKHHNGEVHQVLRFFFVKNNICAKVLSLLLQLKSNFCKLLLEHCLDTKPFVKKIYILLL